MRAPTFDRAAFLERLEALDKALVAAGFPAMAPWWEQTLRRFFLSGRRSLVLRVGRRGGKSSTLCRVAVAWALWGSYHVPPGDTGVVAFISVSRDESAQRLVTIRAILDALDVPYRSAGDEVSLLDRAVVFKTFTASIAGVSGPTCIMVVGDELAKWRDAEDGSNPARQVVSSVKPTVATQPDAPLFWSSSAFGVEDYHAELIDRGDTDEQLVACAETWVANPTISEEETHRLEPDQKIWSREFGNEPGATISAAFDYEAWKLCFRPCPAAGLDADSGLMVHLGQPVCIADPSSGAADEFAWGIVRQIVVGATESFEGLRGLALVETAGVAGFWGERSGGEIIAMLAQMCLEHGARTVFSDQRERLLMADNLPDHGLQFCERTWTNSQKQQAAIRLRRLMSDRLLWCPEHDSKLLKQGLLYQERLTSSGLVTFGAKGNMHDDRVALLMTAMMADMERWIPWAGPGGRALVRLGAPRGPLTVHFRNLGLPRELGGVPYDSAHESAFGLRARAARQGPHGGKTGGF